MASDEYQNAPKAMPRKRRRFLIPGPYELREFARTLIYLAALATIVMGDIWLGGHL